MPVSLFDKPVIDHDTTLDAAASSSGDSGIGEDSSHAPSPPAEEPGTRIGPYKLLQQIGEGGMGIVWMAEQEQPVRRKVALKIIKPGMDSQQVVARFEAERQALALMDHPNIARVLDGGATDSGRPFFVMELIHGFPITKYCDDNQLTLRQRLELFVPICQAIQHAHQKGIIHRDVKPSNVLVTLYDGKPVSKVIDFGVAKAVEQRLTERTLCTQYGSIIGTFEYMSPEQAEMSALGVDTRSDIYSLGVLLYELLTGSTPLERQRLRTASYAEIVRLIREDEPPRPSTRLNHSETLPSVAAARQLEPVKLTKLVRGELDWIVMKALEKDRNRRYESANGLGRDVQRYLNDEPVQACPPSAGYRLRKFVRRNRGPVLAVSLVLIFLVLLGAGSGWVVRDQSARRADAAQQAGESLKRARVWLSGDKLALARQELAEAKGRIGSDRAALRELAEEIDTLDTELDRFQHFFDLVEQAHDAEISLALEPALSAETERGTKSSPAAARNIVQDPAKAVPFLLQALSCYQVLEREDWLAALEGGLVQEAPVQQVRHSLYEELLWLVDDVRSRRRDHRSDGKLSPAEAARQGLVYLHKAEQARRPTLAFYRLRALCQSALGDKEAARTDNDLARTTPPTLAVDHYLLGRAALRAEDKAEAVKHFEVALQLEPTHYWSLMDLGVSLAVLGDQSRDFEAAVMAFTGCIMRRPEHVTAWKCRGGAYGKLRQYDQALADCSKAIELKADFAEAWYNRGVVYGNLHQYDKAIANYSKTIELKPDYVNALYNRGNAYRHLHQYDKAIADYSKAIELSPDDADAWTNRGLAYAGLRQYDKAIAQYSKAIELNPDDAKPWNNRGIVYADLRQYDKALTNYSKAIDLKPDYAHAWYNRGHYYWVLHQYHKAIAQYSKAIDLKPDYAEAWNNRGIAYAELRPTRQGRPRLLQGHRSEARLRRGLEQPGRAYQNLGQHDKAVRDCSKAIELKPDDAEPWHNRGAAYADLRQYDKAIADYSKAIELKPDYRNAWYHRGVVYEHLRQYDKAIVDYSKAIELKPDVAKRTATWGMSCGSRASSPRPWRSCAAATNSAPRTPAGATPPPSGCITANACLNWTRACPTSSQARPSRPTPESESSWPASAPSSS